MGRGDVKTLKGKIFRGSFGNKRQRKTNRSVKPVIKSAFVKPKSAPIPKIRDKENKKDTIKQKKPNEEVIQQEKQDKVNTKSTKSTDTGKADEKKKS